MKGKNIFQKKKEFDLESAVKLSEVKGETVELNDFEIYTSRKYRTDFAVIETGEGNLYMTWGQVVVQKLEELKELPAEEWQGLDLKVVEKQSKNGYNYVDLEA